MNRFAISPVPPSNVRGSDFAGIQYAFSMKRTFPTMVSISSKRWQIMSVKYMLTTNQYSCSEDLRVDQM